MSSPDSEPSAPPTATATSTEKDASDDVSELEPVLPNALAVLSLHCMHKGLQVGSLFGLSLGALYAVLRPLPPASPSPSHSLSPSPSPSPSPSSASAPTTSTASASSSANLISHSHARAFFHRVSGIGVRGAGFGVLATVGVMAAKLQSEGWQPYRIYDRGYRLNHNKRQCTSDICTSVAGLAAFSLGAITKDPAFGARLLPFGVVAGLIAAQYEMSYAHPQKYL